VSAAARPVRLAVLDYKLSNLHSATKALERLGAIVTVVDAPTELDVDGVVLPGVGNFGQAATRIREQGLDEVVAWAVETRRPLLGICLGMQLFFEESVESPGVPGLGVLAGSVEMIPTDEKLPSIGWRRVRWVSEPDRDDAFYFVHTYACVPDDPSIVTGTAHHGVDHCAAVRSGPVTGFQFHPEKSSRAGLALLGRWLAEVGAGAEMCIA
jgi:imidazole glycerol-phosphate synthase subunit HisH